MLNFTAKPFVRLSESKEPLSPTPAPPLENNNYLVTAPTTNDTPFTPEEKSRAKEVLTARLAQMRVQPPPGFVRSTPPTSLSSASSPSSSALSSPSLTRRTGPNVSAWLSCPSSFLDKFRIALCPVVVAVFFFHASASLTLACVWFVYIRSPPFSITWWWRKRHGSSVISMYTRTERNWQWMLFSWCHLRTLGTTQRRWWRTVRPHRPPTLHGHPGTLLDGYALVLRPPDRTGYLQRDVTAF